MAGNVRERLLEELAGASRRCMPWHRDPRVAHLSHLARKAIALSTTGAVA
ncbi:hypothetical protein ACWDBW_46960 [Streptomyces sp. NPDC001107]